ncbi:universal stress protein [Thioalkalivibrio paradoxus]|nr:universal stress protein [Thioalkalivibrio paradoxus]
MFEHILVAVDFSPAWQRLQTQPERLRSLGCNRLTLVHVRGGARDEEEAERDEGAAKQLDEAAATLQGKGFELDTVVGTGPVVEELVRVAQERGAGVILAGAHGHRTLDDLLLGCTAQDLIRGADRPVLLAPTDPSVELPAVPVSRLLLATDGSPAAGGAEAVFLELLRHCDSAVVVSVGGWVDQREYAAERQAIEDHVSALAERAGKHDFDAELLGRGRPSAEIARVAQEHDVDLVILGRRGHSLLAERLLGSTAEAVCQQARRLTLVVPDNG